MKEAKFFKRIHKTLEITITGLLILFVTSCENFLEVERPKSKITKSSVFNSESSANLALIGIYSSMLNSASFSTGTANSITTLAGLSADELKNYPRTDPYIVEFEENDLTARNTIVATLWSSLYETIYMTNSAIEGLSNSTISEKVRSQYLGECYFIRAFCHFYLVNLFGDVPLITTTDAAVNAIASRTKQSDVYDQILSDLTVAQALLANDYDGRDRTRATRGVATALLARTYLYLGDWKNAEIQASQIIGDSRFRLTALNDVFLANSPEAIWQLRPLTTTGTTGYTYEAYIFTPPTLVNFNFLRSETAGSFESNDARFSSWVGKYIGINYPYKYKQNILAAPLTEFSMVMRLAEQYLIRAEARARQENLLGAASDLNAIRQRAGLPPVGVSTLESTLLQIEQERKVELFTEWGHRWFDLKRTNRANDILGSLKPKWNFRDALYPIPQTERNKDKNLNPQNPGY